MWSLVTVMESPSVDLPSEVTADAQAALIRMGWQPPPIQEPTGSFLLPKGGPMKLTRHQADVAVRELTHQFVKGYGEENREPLQQFTLELSAKIGHLLDAGYVWDVVRATKVLIDIDNGDRPYGHKDFAESDLNTSVNDCLDIAGIGTSRPRTRINRNGDQKPVSA